MSSSVICIIDDDASVLKGLTRLFQAWGYTVRPFSSAQQFLEQPAHEDAGIACLVVDVHMPGMSGVELRATLEITGRRLPIVFLTGVGGDTVLRRKLIDGAVRILEKPFDDVELRSAVEKAAAVVRSLS
jgi:two-component system, LuxR family, response regulator FixJ